MMSCGVSNVWYAKQEREWERYQVEDSNEVVSTVFLIGDAGKPAAEHQEPVLKTLERDLKQCTSPNKAILFLGDNVYHNGLEEEGAPGRKESERRLNEQLRAVQGFEGKVIFIPGNHDWNYSQRAGWDAVLRQEEYIEAYLENENVMYPGYGCPGPVEVPLGNNIVMILVDSEWWLHAFQKPVGPLNICDVEDEYDFIAQLNDALDRNRRKNIILAMHHPLMTNGNHGGHFSLKDHFFPLTLIRGNLFIPLPIIGSLYPLARTYGLSRQDITNPRYRLMAESIKRLIYDRQNVVVACGHDHNLQLHPYQEVYQVISGSGSKVNYVTRGREASFIAHKKGYARIDYYKNGEVWVQFCAPGDKGEKTDTLFKKPLYSYQLGTVPDPLKTPPDYTDSTISIAAGPEYANRFFLKRWVLGEHYRKEWTTPVRFRYLDMEREKGGLVPLKRGGGKQTSSLRLRGGDGNQYMLRTINKNPELLLPEGLRNTLAGNIFQDQISAAHPYGAVTLPPMADAIGIYHTDPELRYVPFTPSLGIYLDEYAGKTVLMEIRPDEDLSEFRRFGNSKNVVGTEKMHAQLIGDNDNSVDARALVTNRLFDMLIGDWDRHQDQWRWAEFEKEGKGELYVPIPRDRDQVYGKYDGLLPAIAASPAGKRNLSSFTHRIRDVKGINISGTYLERELANGLSRGDWIEIAEQIRENLPDSLIEASVKRMPEEIFALHGEEIIAKLKSRRDDLPRVADRYYEILAKEIKIITSNKHELVLVDRFTDSTRVSIFKIKKEGDVKDLLYKRTFLQAETKNIAIYTLDGNDSIRVSGTGSNGIRVRVIGGHGKDYFSDDSKVAGPCDKTFYYDDPDTGNTIKKGRETRVRIDPPAYAHHIGLREYSYDFTKPIARIKFDKDNGFTLGIGARVKTFGFRTQPYQSYQKFILAYTTRISALSARYEGEFPMLFSRKNGLEISAQYTGDDNKINYFGQGNETPNTLTVGNYRLNYFEHHVSPSLVHGFNRHVKLRAGPRIEFTRFTPGFNRGLALDNTPDVTDSVYTFYGGALHLDLNYLDSDNDPHRGIRWHNGLNYRASIGAGHREFARLSTDFAIYFTPAWRFRFTTVVRIGGEHLIGNYPFFKSAFLGGNEQLRGYRMTRFAGRSSAYQSIETRLRIHTLRTIVATGEYGLFGFVDNGRVWADNEISHTWHQGYGGGLWLNLFNLSVVSGGVGFSKEGTYFRLDYGYFF